MSDDCGWMPKYRTMCPEPGPLDMFLLVFINGRRVGIMPIADRPKMTFAAKALTETHNCQVKLLPVTSEELMNFLRFKPAEQKPIEDLDAEFRKQAIQNGMDVLRENNRPEQREDAFVLLRQLGALHDQ